MAQHIAALICGRIDDNRFPGRNTFPLLGRPMMVYPILAAQNSQYVDRVFLTTDAHAIARVARYRGVEIIERPPELSSQSVTLDKVVVHGFDAVTKALGEEPEVLVVLLCNAPTVTGGLIDKGLELLMRDQTLDAVMSVSRRNEYHPRFALQLGDGELLTSVIPKEDRIASLSEIYFPDSLLWVVKPRKVFDADIVRTLGPNCIVNCAASRVQPLIHEGFGDVDYEWQIPAIEEWLRRQGFSDEATPYDRHPGETSAEGRKPVPSPARSPKSGTGRRILITTVPFAEADSSPLRLLEREDADYVINPLGRKLREGELADLIHDVDVLIAGTEPITAAVMDRATRLRLISRVGIGLDSVDLLAARERGIAVSYTPEAPAPAVAELTVGLMLSALRFIAQADRGIRSGVWHRHMGDRLSGKTVGVIGVGRVGTRVIQHLLGFDPTILVNDLVPDRELGLGSSVRWTDKETIYRDADIITLHLPLTSITQNLVGRRELNLMRPHAILINTSRGHIVDEHGLAEALRNHRLAAAALDVFQQEPYAGPLTTVENCILTCHMGSMTKDCRARMEVEATEEVIRFLNNQPLRQPVPDSEYHMRG